VADLARRYSNQIGFLPGQALATYIDRGCVQMATENGEPAGYVLAGRPPARNPDLVKIIQTAVALDARRRRHALALIDVVAANARDAGAKVLQACCRRDLESNAFWAAAGFLPLGIRTAPTARGEAHVIWRRQLCPVDRRQLHTLERPYRNAGPGGRFLPATAVQEAYVIRRTTPEEAAELLALHLAA